MRVMYLVIVTTLFIYTATATLNVFTDHYSNDPIYRRSCSVHVHTCTHVYLLT